MIPKATRDVIPVPLARTATLLVQAINALSAEMGLSRPVKSFVKLQETRDVTNAPHARAATLLIQATNALFAEMASSRRMNYAILYQT